VDAIAGTVDTKNPRDYWYHIKNRPMNEDAIPLLRRNRYNIEAIAKALTGEREHKCENLIGSCRHAAAENQPIPRRESPAAARARKRAQDAKSASLLSDDLWGRFRLMLYRFLKNLYRSSA